MRKKFGEIYSTRLLRPRRSIVTEPAYATPLARYTAALEPVLAQRLTFL